MKLKLNKKSQGFTIIEVMIVLAIAGLIMVIVFLAVPALQRNSRNAQIRNEANRIAAAALEVSANKGGTVLVTGDADTVKTTANASSITAVYIAAHSATAITGDKTVAASATNVRLTSVIIRTGAKCAGAQDGTATSGGTRQVAIYYALETTSGEQLQCIDS